MNRKPDRNFAVAPTVTELAEMMQPTNHLCAVCGRPWEPGVCHKTQLCPAPDAVDIPCDASGEAEAHDPRCDCDSCTERAESRQDELEQAQIHDIEREP
jgi:hypothetical protein